MKVSVSLRALALVAVVSARNFTVKNSCSYTVWPAIFTDLNVGSATPDQPTGWKAPGGTEVSFNVPDNWTSGRIWARTECDFSGDPGPTSCATGGCNGGLLCDAHTGTGVPPATVAEFTLSGGGSSTTESYGAARHVLKFLRSSLLSGINVPMSAFVLSDDGKQDNYDVSLVDGFNVPMKVTNNAGCGVPSCTMDLNPKCPSPLAIDDTNGKVVGCNSACAANLDGDPANSPNCCSGSYDTPKTCPSSGVAYYRYFKDACPNSYAYAYDESSGTALYHCDSSLGADYTIEFCP